MSKLSPAAKAAKAWGEARAHELIAEMKDRAFDEAFEFQADPQKFLAEALRHTAGTLERERPSAKGNL